MIQSISIGAYKTDWSTFKAHNVSYHAIHKELTKTVVKHCSLLHQLLICQMVDEGLPLKLAVIRAKNWGIIVFLLNVVGKESRM